MTKLVSNHDLSADFRLAMRRLTATVSIVTCADETGRHGMTATAVTSVSLHPPTILVCINAEARLHAKVAKQRRFCVNLLKVGHIALSERFGSKQYEHDRFAVGDWSELDGLPYLKDSQASLSCSTQQHITAGSHGIFVAHVDQIIVADEIEPLLYQNGAYVAAQPVLRDTRA
jgi:flavin reductase